MISNCLYGSSPMRCSSREESSERAGGCYDHPRQERFHPQDDTMVYNALYGAYSGKMGVEDNDRAKVDVSDTHCDAHDYVDL